MVSVESSHYIDRITMSPDHDYLTTLGVQKWLSYNSLLLNIDCMSL